MRRYVATLSVLLLTACSVEPPEETDVSHPRPGATAENAPRNEAPASLTPHGTQGTLRSGARRALISHGMSVSVSSDAPVSSDGGALVTPVVNSLGQVGPWGTIVLPPWDGGVLNTVGLPSSPVTSVQ
jgi:hypothetical protein